ncbi:MAG: hypothetical protein JW834_02680 [Candidatus Diapherotrites archaeon]|nr:hypothetical protein [Candidatus Diapherotrites archaeon]
MFFAVSAAKPRGGGERPLSRRRIEEAVRSSPEARLARRRAYLNVQVDSLNDHINQLLVLQEPPKAETLEERTHREAIFKAHAEQVLSPFDQAKSSLERMNDHLAGQGTAVPVHITAEVRSAGKAIAEAEAYLTRLRSENPELFNYILRQRRGL